MNTAVAFLTHNWKRLALDRFGTPSELSCVVYTPLFQASAHVIFLILTESSNDPVLVAKVSRFPGMSAALDREAANLQAVQVVWPDRLDSVPRLLAYDDFAGTRLLLETGVPGRILKPALVRRRPEEYTELLVDWIIDFHSATVQPDPDVQETIQLLSHPFAELERALPSKYSALIDRTRELTGSLQRQGVPLVFEHGDLSAPNILLSEAGELGVVDWELARPRGLPVMIYSSHCPTLLPPVTVRPGRNSSSRPVTMPSLGRTRGHVPSWTVTHAVSRSPMKYSSACSSRAGFGTSPHLCSGLAKPARNSPREELRSGWRTIVIFDCGLTWFSTGTNCFHRSEPKRGYTRSSMYPKGRSRAVKEASAGGPGKHQNMIPLRMSGHRTSTRSCTCPLSR